jgi:hypothetical protein
LDHREVWQRRAGTALGTFALIGLAFGAPIFGGFLLESGTWGSTGTVRQNMGMQPGAMGLGGGPIVVEEAMEFAALPMPTMAPIEDMAKEMDAPASDAGEAQASAQAPRLRQLFGETMAWMPELVTEADGTLQVDLPLYDNFTTWL